jgi:hypothetical protein
MELANFGHSGSDLISGRSLRRPHLLAQQFLIDQTVKNSFAFLGCKGVGIAAIGKRLKGYFLFPVALQNDMTVNIGYDTIDDLSGKGGGGQGKS